MQVGDRVLFHYVEAHICQRDLKPGEPHRPCHCDEEAPRQSREATVMSIDADGEATLHVEFTQADADAGHGFLPEQQVQVQHQDMGLSSRPGWTPLS